MVPLTFFTVNKDIVYLLAIGVCSVGCTLLPDCDFGLLSSDQLCLIGITRVRVLGEELKDCEAYGWGLPGEGKHAWRLDHCFSRNVHCQRTKCM